MRASPSPAVYKASTRPASNQELIGSHARAHERHVVARGPPTENEDRCLRRLQYQCRRATLYYSVFEHWYSTIVFFNTGTQVHAPHTGWPPARLATALHTRSPPSITFPETWADIRVGRARNVGGQADAGTASFGRLRYTYPPARLTGHYPANVKRSSHTHRVECLGTPDAGKNRYRSRRLWRVPDTCAPAHHTPHDTHRTTSHPQRCALKRLLRSVYGGNPPYSRPR